MATLKISDLSVGDWVRCGQWNGCIQRIAMHDGKTVEVIIEANCARMYMYKRVYEINSIPITPEILEANGFVKNGKYNEWNTGNWEDIPFIGISLSRQSMRIRNIGTDIFLENKVVYVHQLQHALRLAGIDKEIQL